MVKEWYWSCSLENKKVYHGYSCNFLVDKCNHPHYAFCIIFLLKFPVISLTLLALIYFFTYLAISTMSIKLADSFPNRYS
jgi:hypothetical protein